ncbi:MAG TPA: hypothetical protein VI248_07405 [Kineosporiaceae bacterium]
MRAGTTDAIMQAVLADRLDPAHLADALGALADDVGAKISCRMDTLRPVIDEPLMGYRALQMLTALVPRLLQAQTRDVHHALSLCRR